MVAFLLDVKLQATTGGRRSLDDVLRLAYGRYAGERGFTRAEFRALAQDVAGADLQAWFVSALETTDELGLHRGSPLVWVTLQTCRPLLRLRKPGWAW